MECYRRLIQGNGKRGTWEKAPVWERHSLERYQEIQNDKRMRRAGPVCISTSHPEVGMFMATFQEKTAGLYVFHQEDQEVEMMWAPSRLSKTA